MKHRFFLFVIALMTGACSSGSDSSETAEAGGLQFSAPVINVPKQARVVSDDQPFELRVSRGQGDSWAYTVTSEEKGGEKPQKTSMLLTMKVASAKGEELNLETKMMGLKLNGKDAPKDQAAALTKTLIKTTINKFGKPLKSAVTNPGPGTFDYTQLLLIAIPEHRIKLGDEWDGEMLYNNKNLKCKFKLVTIEQKNGVKAGKFEAIFSFPDIKLTAPMSYWVDLSNGVVVSGSLETELSKGVTRTISIELKSE